MKSLQHFAYRQTMYDCMVDLFKELLKRNAKRIEGSQKFRYESLRKFKQAMGTDIEWL